MQTHLQYPSTDGIQLDGVLLETEVPKRAVLMLHGINSSKEEPLYPFLPTGCFPSGSTASVLISAGTEKAPANRRR